MNAIPAWITAEVNRDRKRHRKPFSIWEWTVTGLIKGAKKKKPPKPQALWDKIGGAMAAFGGKADGIDDDR